jgi:outer membrane receptor protein involved in Fe transport
VRGINRPGDYDSRILLLVDGYRVNDVIYDTAYIGTELGLDVEMIDRVEIIRGPGSSVYGSNAFLAVINVITRRGRDIGGVEASAEVGSFGSDRQRVAIGGRTKGGLEGAISASRYRSRGQDLYFPELDTPETSNGLIKDSDGDRYERLFGKVRKDNLALTAGYSRRVKAVPTASFGSAFGDQRERTSDQTAFVDLSYDARLGADWEITPHVYFGRYVYRGIYPYEAPPIVLNNDSATGTWWGSDVKAVARLREHTLVLGGEYQHNPRQDQLNFDQEPMRSTSTTGAAAIGRRSTSRTSTVRCRSFASMLACAMTTIRPSAGL